MIRQQHTETVLCERLASFEVEVELDCQLVDLIQHQDSIVAEVVRSCRSETIQARFLVGCDGGHSAVRKAVGISFLGETWDEEHFLVGNVRVSGLDLACWHYWTNPAWGTLTLNPMPQSDTWFYVASLSPEEYHALSTPTLESLQRLFDERAGMHGIRFSSPTWLSAFGFNLRVADQYRDRRVFLAGDSVHVGLWQGMNIGIQDAYNLGWKLAHVLAGAQESLLATYQAERLPLAHAIQATTSTRHQADSGDGSIASQVLFNATSVSSDTTQLSITYRGSPLARDLDDTAGIRAGDRAPDATCVRAGSNEQVRLFDLFQGTHFTLLAFGEQPAPHLPAAYDSSLRAYTVAHPEHTTVLSDHVLVDSDGQAHRAYGSIGNALILVRPDGYVGLTAGVIDPGPILDYLRDVTGP
jgi:hypothetical protein